jgi:hypothetical protein
MTFAGHVRHCRQRDRCFARADWRKNHGPVTTEEKVGGVVLVWSEIHFMRHVFL